MVDYSIESEETASATVQAQQVTQLTTALTTLFTSGSGASVLGVPVLSSNLGSSTGGGTVLTSTTTTSTAASSTTATVTIGDTSTDQISIGQTLLATATVLAPMMYAMNKKPEVVEQLQELYGNDFLGEDSPQGVEAMVEAALLGNDTAEETVSFDGTSQDADSDSEDGIESVQGGRRKK